MLGLSLCGTWMTACGGDGSGVSEKVATVLDEKRVLAGAAAQSMSLGSGSEMTDLLFPAGILKTPATLTVRLSKDVVKAGAAPTGPCVQVANKGVVFAVAAQMRQVLPPPATGMHYVGVHADEQAAAWTEQADARVAGALSGDGDGGPSGGGDGGGASDGGTTATWEIDMNGSGLWAMALVPIGGTNGDGGIVDDAGGPGTVDGGDPSTRPQLTQIVPAQGTAGTLVPVEIHGRNITSGWSIVVDGQLVSTTIAPVSLNGVSDGNGALGAVMLDAAIVTGQVPVWLALGDLRSNTLYLNIAPAPGAPTIIDYTPDNGLPGSTVSIIGTNLMTEPVTIRDPLGRVIVAQGMGPIAWVGASVERVDIVIPADMTSGILTASNSKGSFRGRIFNVGQNLARLSGATAQSSTQFNATNWSTASGWDNNLQTSWFSLNGDCATGSTTCTTVPYFQVTFPTAQTVARIALRGNREYATGYDFVEGWFELRAADGSTLWKGDYVLPEPDRDLDIVFPTPMAGAASVRFTSISDQSTEPGFSELEVFGP